MATHRGTSNSNKRGSSYARQRRREWLVETYRANVELIRVEWRDGEVNHFPAEWGIENYAEILSVVSAELVPTCRCYRCGDPLTVETVTVDRIIPGCKGGKYVRNNIRPACGPCNSETGGALAHRGRRAS